MTDLHGRLRTATIALHDQLEALPFFQALRAGELPGLAIVSFLRCLAILHAVLEGELARTADPAVAALARHARPKLPLLAADLEAVGAPDMPSVMPAIGAALDHGAEILAGAADPLNLVGALYVFEGSQNGGFALKSAYASCLGLREDQLTYFGCYGAGTAAHWHAFSDALNVLGLEGEPADRAAQAAVRCFARLGTICAALHPYAAADLRHHVTAINFWAGDHAMPQDPLEIGLALRAGRTAWEQYPYLEQRFAERGRRFTSSDSCWLVALARQPAATACGNLGWLRTVLASRGIPTVILAAHLRAILQALAVEFAGEAGMRAGFERFLSALDAERQALDGAGMVARLVDRFDRRLRGCAGPGVDSAAQLIASAWIDERSGIAGALAAVRGWFTDAERFPNDWIAAVNALLAALDRAGGPPC